jgi:hypothetical protein
MLVLALQPDALLVVDQSHSCSQLHRSPVCNSFLLLGLFAFHVGAGFVHLLLVASLIMIVLHFLYGEMAAPSYNSARN